MKVSDTLIEDDAVEEVWTPSRRSKRLQKLEDEKKEDEKAQDEDYYVNNANAKYPTGTEIQKQFGDGKWYIGWLQFVWVDEESGVELYRIEYEDGDSEDLEEHQMDVVVEYAQEDMQAQQSRFAKKHHAKQSNNNKKQKRAKAASSTTSTTATTRIPAPAPAKRAAAATGRRPLTKKARRGTTASGKKDSQTINDDSDLWNIFGEEEGQELKESLENKIKANPPPHLPKGLQMCVPLMVEFWLLVWERQMVTFGKQTTVQLFQSHHFCNNHREMDRGTAYLRSQLINLYFTLKTEYGDDQPITRADWLEQVLAMAYVYRLANKQESFQSERNPNGGIPRLGEWTKDHEAYCWSVQRDRERNSSKNAPSFMTKAHQAISYDEYIQYGRATATMVPPVAQQILEAGTNLRRICSILQQLGGVSNFRAWQLACDLQEANCLGPDDEYDDEYTLLGPGARNGLRDVFGDEVFRDISALELCRYLQDNMAYCLSLVDLEFPHWGGRPVTLKVIEHALCEFSKFQRADAGILTTLRTRDSRSRMDDKPCGYCCTNTTIGKNSNRVRCDTCFEIVCRKCSQKEFHSLRSPDQEYERNCCKNCHMIESLIFDD